ncbi:MAG: TlpA family protein disulfide reductase [Burkholderiales bacterium]|nr:TlpA family protein disulfide reductase [Burkholderiales bacterium]
MNPPAGSSWSRRHWLGATAAGLLVPRTAAAQPASVSPAPPASPLPPVSPASTDGAAQEAKAPPLPAPGTPITIPAIDLLDGQRFEPVMAEGRVLLLYWWASWCPFCALTSPHIDKLWQAQRQRGGQGLAMLTFSIDKKPEEARAYLQRRGYAWPAAWVSPALHRALPKPRGLPVLLLRGRDGRVLQAEAGQLFPEDVEALARHAG